jgi:hypothetical protein
LQGSGKVFGVTINPATVLLDLNSLKYSDSNEILVFNGDSFFELDLNQFVHQSRQRNRPFSIALSEMENFDRYGKWGDVPFMLETIQSGKAVVLTDACGWMGLHAGQDTNDPSTRPAYQAWINREANFYRFMGDDPFSLSGLSFCIMNFRHMRSGYKRRVRKDVSFKQFLAEAQAASALTTRGKWARWLAFRFVQKMLEGYLRSHYRKIAKSLL